MRLQLQAMLEELNAGGHIRKPAGQTRVSRSQIGFDCLWGHAFEKTVLHQLDSKRLGNALCDAILQVEDALKAPVKFSDQICRPEGLSTSRAAMREMYAAVQQIRGSAPQAGFQ